MKKLCSPTELRTGHVYNCVYVGDNDAYARINGKETFLVINIKPLETVELFDQFGDPYTDDIRSTLTTHGSITGAFKECEIFQPSNESEWFRKSVRVNSLADALKQGGITIADIKRKADWRGQSPFVTTIDCNQKLKGIHCSFCVEDKTDRPLLQTVFVVWQTWVELADDFKKQGIKVRL